MKENSGKTEKHVRGLYYRILEKINKFMMIAHKRSGKSTPFVPIKEDGNDVRIALRVYHKQTKEVNYDMKKQFNKKKFAKTYTPRYTRH